MTQSKYHLLFLFILSIQSCVDEISIENNTKFKSALVVEATITNEEKIQEILLTRTYGLNDEGPSSESDAIVKIIDADGFEYDFEETSPGKYKSLEVFAAQPNIDYNIAIITKNGRIYSSKTVQLTHPTEIDELFFERNFNENGVEGVSLFLNTFDPTSSSNYYRFKYEETYKIIAPLWTSLDLIDFSVNPPTEPVDEQYGFIPRSIDELICYKTNMSNSIIIADTKNLVEDRLDNFRVLFLNRNNYIISSRYSILVSQYVQSAQAYTYYQTLNDISESDNILSETQPGLLSGNLFSVSDEEENVIGFFEVVAADTKRVYFNYDDLFPDDALPPYAIQCRDFYAPTFTELPDVLASGQYKYYLNNDEPEDFEGPYFLVPGPCGDCTYYGNSTPPIWWED